MKLEKLKSLKPLSNPKTAKIELIFWLALIEGELLGMFHHYNLSLDDFDIEFLNNPHNPKPLPRDKAAIMLFFHERDCLFVGFAGANSNSRFQSHHYFKAAHGTTSLAKHILRDRKIDTGGLPVSQWIRNRCWRINIYVDGKTDRQLLKDLSGFLHVQFHARYGKRRT